MTNKRRILTVVIGILILIGRHSFAAEEGKAVDFEEKHKDKAALFLLYDVSVKVNNDWSYVTKVHKKVKILKDDAKNMGEIPIYYENNRQKVTGIEAFTIAPDNKKYRYSKVQDLSTYKGYPMYSDSKVKIVTLPQVTIGSILENKYTIESKSLPIKNAFWYQYYLDSTLPIKELCFLVTMPKSLDIKYKEFGLTSKPKITETASDITYAWVVKDIDADTETENYLPPPTPESFENTVEFSSIKNWQDISNWYASLVTNNLVVNDEMKEAVNKITKDKLSVKDKTKAILEYVQEDFRYVSMSFGDNTLEPHPTVEVFKNKYGDCKDLSLLCKAMLSVTGINSYICLFNTEFYISDPQFDLPIPSLFNHVFLLVDDPNGESFYIDPLLKGYDIGEYPLAYQGGYLFIVNNSGGRLARFPIFDEKRDYTSSNRTITIEEDGSALIEAEVIWDLDFSVEQRDKLNSLTEKEKKEFYEGLDAYIAADGQMLKRDIVGLDQKYGTMKTYNKMKLNNVYPITDGLLIIDISGFERGTDFTQKERKKPIFYPLNSINEEMTTFKIPQGYSVSYLPPNLNMDNGFYNIRREYVKAAPNEIKMTEVTRCKRTEVSNKEYDKVKDFFDKLPNKTQQRIIVKKDEAR